MPKRTPDQAPKQNHSGKGKFLQGIRQKVKSKTEASPAPLQRDEEQVDWLEPMSKREIPALQEVKTSDKSQSVAAPVSDNTAALQRGRFGRALSRQDAPSLADPVSPKEDAPGVGRASHVSADGFGIFGEAIDWSKFSQYLPDLPVDSVGSKPVDAAVQKQTEPVEESAKAGAIDQLKQYLGKQKALLERLQSVASLPIFQKETLGKLLTALPLINRAKPAVPSEQSAASKTAQQSEASAQPEGQIKTPAEAADEITAVPEEEPSQTPAAQKAPLSEDIELRDSVQVPATEPSSTESETQLRESNAELGLSAAEAQASEQSATASTETPETPVQPQTEPVEIAEEEIKRREQIVEEKKQQKMQQNKQERKEKPPPPKARKKVEKTNAFAGFMRSLQYFGLGKERSSFVDNLGTMMDAGLPLLDALHALQEETRNRSMRKIITRVVAAVELGSPLWRAMDSQYFFTPQEIALVRVGEEAGNLTENLQYLSEQEEKDRALRSKVQTAMIYPAIILTMLTGIVIGLGMFVLPNLISVLFSLNVELPFTTRIIIGFTNLFTTYGKTAIPAFFGGVIILAVLAKFTRFKIVVQWVLYKIPGIGTLIREATLSRFGVIMGGLLRAGVPITESLDSLVEVTTLARYRHFYQQLLEHIKLGDSFQSSFSKIKSTKKCLPGSMQQLIVTGEQSGSLTHIMLKISEIHERRASNVAEKLPVILEPMLLLFIGALVGMIALGILAPIYSVVGNVGGA